MNNDFTKWWVRLILATLVGALLSWGAYITNVAFSNTTDLAIERTRVEGIKSDLQEIKESQLRLEDKFDKFAGRRNGP